jgi:hypothetical protein
MSLILRFVAALLAFINSAIPTGELQLAVRNPDPIVVIPTPVITDLTGEALEFLRESFTPAEILAGGNVTIVFSGRTGGIAVVPYFAGQYTECEGADTCIMVAPEWSGRGDYARVIIDHEWAHILVLRRTQALSSSDAVATWIDAVLRVNEECLADAVASLVLARGGFAPNETSEYVAHYSCEDYWQGRYGVSLIDETVALAINLLNWAA